MSTTTIKPRPPSSPIYYLEGQGKGGYSPDGTLPSGAVVCTKAQHDNSMSWDVQNGALVAATPPVQTDAEKALEALLAGLAVKSAANSALDATYSVSAEMQANLVALDGYYAKFNTFPNKSATVTIPDMTGKGHVFTYAEFEALFQTLGDYRAALVECANGTSTTLPNPANYGNIP